jgi:adenylate cyclase
MFSRIGTVEAHKASLSKYFSPNVVEEITNNPDVIEKGMRQKVTVLFSDIKDFTKMSERLTPSELVDLLNSVRSI